MPNKKEITYSIDETMTDVTEKKCPILHALEIIGQKWKLPILWYLHEKENTRYNELKRRIPGITNMMLTKSLRIGGRRLSKACSVRHHSAEGGILLTEEGLALLPTLNELYKWGELHMNKQ